MNDVANVQSLRSRHQRWNRWSSNSSSTRSNVEFQRRVQSTSDPFPTALLNRLLNADVPDHARILLSSSHHTALRKKDGGIRPIAVGNGFRHLASKVGYATVTPSLARQLSPTQIGVGIQGACEAAVPSIHRYVIDHIASGQSHQNRLIDKFDLKNALSTVRRDHLLRVCSQRALPIARLAHLSYSSPSTVLTSGHQICSATGI